MTYLTRSLTPSRLRLILSITLVLILIAGTGLFYLAYRQLSNTATETGTMAASAKESEDTLQRLQALKKKLESQQDIIQKTELITADSTDYAYQNRVINDLTAYASKAGMEISNITFATQTGESSTPPPPAAAETTPGTDETGAAPEGTAAAPAPAAGLKKASINVTLKNPVDYKGLLNFLHYIEQNVMKLKVSNITLTKNEGDLVTTDVLNLEVYIR